MESRQIGVPMGSLIEAVQGNAAEKFTVQMIIRAYDTPRYSVERNQKRAVEDFKNDSYLECFKAKNK